MHFSTVALGVRHVARSLEFYRDGLALPLRSHRDDLVTFETGATRLCLYPADRLASFSGRPASPAGPSVVLSLNVDDDASVDRIVRRCSARGGSIARPAGILPWGGYGACVADPDGHVWEIVHAG